MALSLGQLLAGAGQVSVGMRRAEEAERVARENQLKIEEQNRQALDQMRRAQEQDPRFAPVPSGMPQYQPIQFPQMPQRQVPVPAAPLGYQGPTAEQLAFAEANITPGPVGRGEVPPPRAPGALSQGRAFEPVAPAQIPTSVEAIGLRFEAARTAYRDAKAKLDKYGARQRASDPAGYEAARLAEMQARTARDAAQREWETAVGPYTQAVQVQPRMPAGAPGAAPQPAAAQPSPVAPQPTVKTRVTPETQAARDKDKQPILLQELAKERQRALSGDERAIANVNAIEREMRRSGFPVPPAAPAAAPAAPTPAPTVVAPQATLAPVAQNVANAVLNAAPRLLQVDPARLSQAMQETQESLRQQREIMVQQRNGLARMAQLGMQSGTAAGQRQAQEQLAQVSQADLALRQFDLQTRQAMIYMQGMEGLQIFAQTNNPAALAGVWSYFSKVPIGVQPRSDGQFDLFVDGQLSEEGLTKDQIQERAQLGMFQSARDAVAKAAELRNTLALKRQFSDAQINAMKDIWVALINQQGRLSEVQLQNMKETVTSVEGGVFYKTPQGLVYISPGGIEPVPGEGQRRIMNVTPVVIPGR